MCARACLPDDRPFTTAMAAARGYDRKSLSRLVQDGGLRRLFTGVYAASTLPLTTEVRVEAARLQLLFCLELFVRSFVSFATDRE